MYMQVLENPKFYKSSFDYYIVFLYSRWHIVKKISFVLQISKERYQFKGAALRFHSPTRSNKVRQEEKRKYNKKFLLRSKERRATNEEDNK